jgi:hypothetical protein
LNDKEDNNNNNNNMINNRPIQRDNSNDKEDSQKMINETNSVLSLQLSEDDTSYQSSRRTSTKGRQRSKHNNNNGGEGLLAKDETRSVNRVRIYVGAVIVLSTLTMALTFYFFVRNSEQKTFERSFTADANKVLNGIGDSVKANLAAMDSFASNMVSIAKQTNQTFPFVTIPKFAIKASKLLSLCHGFTLSTQPVVAVNQRTKWEAYTKQSHEWVNETKQIQQLDVFYHDVVEYGGEENLTTIIGRNGTTLPYDNG